jgi:enoyl-CoA hydratase
LALFAELHDARQAQAVGLVHAVCTPERLVDEAVGRATGLAAIAPETFALTKRQLHAPAEARIAERTEHDDAEVHRRWKSADARAEIGAFLIGLNKSIRR